MKNNYLIGFFFLMVLVQLFVPANMVFQREEIIDEGKTFKFKTAPIDPNDPFRGKYVSLNFEDNTIEVEDIKDWEGISEGYVILETNDEGFAQAKELSAEKPPLSEDFVKVERIAAQYNSKKVWFDYKFDRFYMEEFKAKPAETTYREAQLDSTKITYALVSVLEGEAVLQDVLIDGVSIKELVTSSEVVK